MNTHLIKYDSLLDGFQFDGEESRLNALALLDWLKHERARYDGAVENPLINLRYIEGWPGQRPVFVVHGLCLAGKTTLVNRAAEMAPASMLRACGLAPGFGGRVMDSASQLLVIDAADLKKPVSRREKRGQPSEEEAWHEQAISELLLFASVPEWNWRPYRRRTLVTRRIDCVTVVEAHDLASVPESVARRALFIGLLRQDWRAAA